MAHLGPDHPDVAAALALYEQGASISSASAEAGIHHRTLERRVAILEADHHYKDEKTELMMRALREARVIQQEAGRQTLEALYQGKIKPHQLPVVFGIMTDKIERLALRMGTDSGASSGAEKLFKLLAQGGKLTLEGPGAAAESASKSPQVIEITAEVEDPT